jgi:hypothetical protein
MSTTITKIGHASMSEHGSVNGTAGDQTEYGTEVCTVENYDISRIQPYIVLRPKTAALANASAAACKDGCDNNHIGYSQNSRNTLKTRAEAVGYDLSKITTNCNTDCSAFLSVCAIAGGANISYGTNGPTTTTMRSKFKQSGDYIVLTDSKHLTMSDYLKRGDILVREGHHTIMVLENNSDYIDDDIPTEQPDTPVEQPGTPITDIRVKYIDVSVPVLTATTATINVKTVERKTGIADKLLSASAVKKYSWKYTIEALDNRNNIKTQTLSPTSSSYTIALAELLPGTTYAIQVIAAKNRHIELCSPKILFTTAQTTGQKEIKKQFNFNASNIDKVYIKVNDEYKHAIVYSNIKE